MHYLPSGVHPPPGEAVSPLLTRLRPTWSRSLGSRLVAGHPHRPTPRRDSPLQILYPSLQLGDDHPLAFDNPQQSLTARTIEVRFSSYLSLMT